MLRYARGTRVLVRVVPGYQDQYSDIWLYENVAGKVVSSTTVAAFESRSCRVDSGPPRQILVEEYVVLLDNGIQIDHIAEECLEELKHPD